MNLDAAPKEYAATVQADADAVEAAVVEMLPGTETALTPRGLRLILRDLPRRGRVYHVTVRTAR